MDLGVHCFNPYVWCGWGNRQCAQHDAVDCHVTIEKDAYITNIASSMIGSIGLNWIFFTLVILLDAIVYVSLIFLNVPVFQSRMPLSISVGLLVLLVFIEYKIIH